MDNISHRAVIRYLGLKGLTSKEIHEDLVVKLGENAPSQSMVKKWDAEFKCGKDSLDDDSVGAVQSRHPTVDHFLRDQMTHLHRRGPSAPWPLDQVC